jgi:hypothetical protein
VGVRVDRVDAVENELNVSIVDAERLEPARESSA